MGEATTTRGILAGRLKARREYLGLTQGQIANRLGVEAATISNYERGERPIPSDDLPLLAHILRTRVAYFFGEDTEEEQQADDFIRYYKGAPPVLQEAAMNVLRTMHREDDMEQ